MSSLDEQTVVRRHRENGLTVLTSSSEDRLANLSSIQSLIRPGDHPLEQERDVGTIPQVPTVSPPRIVDLGPDEASRAGRVDYIIPLKYNTLCRCAEKVNVDEICLRELG